MHVLNTYFIGFRYNKVSCHSLSLPPLHFLLLSCHPLLSLLFSIPSSFLILLPSVLFLLFFSSLSQPLPSLSSTLPLLWYSLLCPFSPLPFLSPLSPPLLLLVFLLSPTGSFSANFDRTGAHCLGRGKRMSVFGATAFYPQGHCCS